MADQTEQVNGYADKELHDALARYYASGPSNDGESASEEARCRHCFGYGDPNHEMSMLQRITATTILDYEKIVADPTSPIESVLLSRANTFRSTHGPVLNLRSVVRSKRPAMALAAEFKRASPSKGDIAPDLDAGEQAAKYAEAGASTVSVLTEKRWFKGSLDDLTSARLRTAAAVEGTSGSRPAILRKDFVTSRYMIAEAAASGADTILLIVATTPANVLKDLIDYARATCEMEPLVEVHAQAELDVALGAGAKVIGVNNRNLHTFKLDLGTTDRTADELTKRGLSFSHDDDDSDFSLCALSGMSSSRDVDRFRRSGVGMCLIGESLMRAADPKAAIEGLCLHPEAYAKSTTSGTGAGGAYIGGTKIVKICGITGADDAVAACRGGANLIGVIFAEKSKRKVTTDQARGVVDAVREFGERSTRIDVNAMLPSLEGQSPVEALVAKGRALEEAATRPLVVGVFQNQSFEFIREMVETCGLDLVQLHGREGMSAASAKNCGVPALRVVDIELGNNGESDEGAKRSSSDIAKGIIQNITSDPLAILLDTSIKGAKHAGGTGVTFDWGIAEAVQAAGLPVIIAGGLTPSNVGDAVRTVRPYGIDVAGGVEASPGKKDAEKLRDYLSGAKEAAVEASKGF